MSASNEQFISELLFKGETTESERDVWCVVESVAGVLGDCCWPFPELILGGSFSLILVLALSLSLRSIKFVTRLHVTCVIGLFKFEIRVVIFSCIPLLLLSHLVFHGEVSRSVRARQCVNVRWECPIMSGSLLPLNMICLTMISFLILSLSHYI